MPTPEPVLVFTTMPETADATSFATRLVEERLAACVNVHREMESTYRWKGKIERDRERQVVIKTTTDRVELLRARISELHPYELPEFVVVPVDGSKPYLEWMLESTRPD